MHANRGIGIGFLFLLGSGMAIAQAALPVTAESLQKILDQDQLLEFRDNLPEAKALTREQQEFFDGMVAFHTGRFEDAVKPLVQAANAPAKALTSDQIERALETLGENAMRQSQYGAAAKMYDVIDKTWGARMPDGGKSNRDNRHFAALLESVPVQTITFSGDFTLPRTGLTYPISIAGKTFSAQFDTGAELSVISASTAKKWGVTLLEGTASLHGYSGGAFSAQPGFLPVLTIGKAELHNIAVYVTADENLYIPQIKRQTDALLGFPVLYALGRLTFHRDGTLSVAAHSPDPDPKRSVHILFSHHAVLAAVDTMVVLEKGAAPRGTGTRLFMLDTGSGSSYFTDRYLAEHTNVFHGPPPETARLAGAGGNRNIPAYAAHQLPLFFGEAMVFVEGPHILTQPQGGEAEHFFGLLGQDVLGSFLSYTIDFRTGALTVDP